MSTTPTHVRSARRFALALAACSAMAAGVTQAQTKPYPSGPIKFIVAFPAGSGTDTVARVIAESITQQSGQAVVIDNRGGANGFIAAQAVAAAPKDGYTYLFTTSTTHAANAAMFKKLPYDPIKDFAPVSLVTKNGLVLVVPANSPFHNVGELMKALQSGSGKLSLAGGSASTHVAGEMFKMATHGQAVYAAYRGVPQALTDLMGGQLDFMFSDINPALPLVASGKLRALAVTTTERHPAFKEVPTLGESGLPGFEMVTWSAVFAPAGTPRAIVDRMNEMIRAAQKTKAAQEQLERSGAQGAVGTPDELAAFVKSETEKWSRVARDAGLQAE